MSADEHDVTDDQLGRTRPASGCTAGAFESSASAWLVDAEDLEPGEPCPNGGTRVEFGLDLDRDGVLDPEEVTGSSIVCNGEDAERVVFETEAIDPGSEQCPAGGTILAWGTDADGDGEMDYSWDQLVICDGESALQSLVEVERIEGDDECAAGAVLVRSGLDQNENGALDPPEVTSTVRICEGTDGADGSDGGCNASGGLSGMPGLVILLGGLLARRRRR